MSLSSTVYICISFLLLFYSFFSRYICIICLLLSCMVNKYYYIASCVRTLDCTGDNTISNGPNMFPSPYVVKFPYTNTGVVPFLYPGYGGLLPSGFAAPRLPITGIVTRSMQRLLRMI